VSLRIDDFASFGGGDRGLQAGRLVFGSYAALLRIWEVARTRHRVQASCRAGLCEGRKSRRLNGAISG